MNWCCFTLPVMFDFKPNLKKGPCFSSPTPWFMSLEPLCRPQTNVKVKDSRGKWQYLQIKHSGCWQGIGQEELKVTRSTCKIITVYILTADKDRNVNSPYTFPCQPSDSLSVGPITGIKHFASLSNLVNVSFPSSAFVMLKDVAMSWMGEMGFDANQRQITPIQTPAAGPTRS